MNTGAEKKRDTDLLLLLLMGAAVLVICFGLLTLHDTKETKQILRQTLTASAQRVERFNTYVVSDRTKSMIDLLDKTVELSRVLATEEGDRQALLDSYAADQRLGGVVVLDGMLHESMQTRADGDTYSFLQDVIANENVADVLRYDRKCYMTRILLDGAVYELAVAARQDEPGVILAYHRQSADRADGVELSLSTLFEGDTILLDGVVVVSDGEQIVCSNRAELTGLIAAEESNRYSRQENTFYGLSQITNGKRTWYGGRAQVGGYSLYVYFPSSRVFANRTSVLGYITALYILLWTAFLALRQEARRKNLLVLRKQYETIGGISAIFTSCLLVPLGPGVPEVVSAPKELPQTFQGAADTRAVLDALAQQYVAPEFQEQHRAFTDLATVERRLAGQSFLAYTYQDRHGHWIEFIIVPQSRTPEGALQAVLFLTRDVTAKKRQELAYQEELRRTAQQAERASAAKTDFLRRMSHDVRTPINAIRGMVDISRHYRGDEQKQEECRERILSASGFLLELVNNVLDMNKLESGKIWLEEKPFNLRQKLETMNEMLQIQAQELGINFSHEDISGQHWNVIGSPLHLQQVLQNVISNAIKYNRENGSVTFSARELSCDGERVVFRFVCADTGLGMSEEFQRHAFEPFAQEDDTPRGRYVGSGLGLPIVRELTQRMGGTVTFTSKKDQGTTFVITMGFRLAEKAPAAVPPVEEISLKGMHILLAEDNEMNMEIARFVLENQGAEVTGVWNGRQAVQTFMASQPGQFDLILMDVMMPVMNGLEATRHIRAMSRPDARTVPIFAMTANAFADDAERSREAGMNEHLTKPLDAGRLMAAIQRCRSGAGR